MPAENLDQAVSLLAEHPEAAMATLSEPLVSRLIYRFVL